MFFMFKTQEEAGYFQSALEAEGIPTGPKSACRNLMAQHPVQSKHLPHPMLPPFGKGHAGEWMDYHKENEGMKTDGILERMAAIAIGPQYSDDDVGDIIMAIEKVNGG